MLEGVQSGICHYITYTCILLIFNINKYGHFFFSRTVSLAEQLINHVIGQGEGDQLQYQLKSRSGNGQEYFA